jgi:hypothetical protein
VRFGVNRAFDVVNGRAGFTNVASDSPSDLSSCNSATGLWNFDLEITRQFVAIVPMLLKELQQIADSYNQ